MAAEAEFEMWSRTCRRGTSASPSASWPADADGSEPSLLADDVDAVELRVGLRQVNDALDQADHPHGQRAGPGHAEARAQPASAYRSNQHDDPRRGKPGDELVDAEPAQEDAADTGRD